MSEKLPMAATCPVTGPHPVQSSTAHPQYKPTLSQARESPKSRPRRIVAIALRKIPMLTAARPPDGNTRTGSARFNHLVPNGPSVRPPPTGGPNTLQGSHRSSKGPSDPFMLSVAWGKDLALEHHRSSMALVP
ncbi:hypothetical protein BP00DRAFT_497225 [Aspergillus indologenus CBS 114.80]|uniref:Uncharacterized protein n=1 Tax=Aspergillus indologenus CBS 114.80 TaxID=1450541 RepID=A0A2V5HVS2_9EURO|nr:hypothetical protein BP00DRAFT_497225 [Aspergillus indologenus CBS 114.80]